MITEIIVDKMFKQTLEIEQLQSINKELIEALEVLLKKSTDIMLILADSPNEVWNDKTIEQSIKALNNAKNLNL